MFIYIDYKFTTTKEPEKVQICINIVGGNPPGEGGDL